MNTPRRLIGVLIVAAFAGGCTDQLTQPNGADEAINPASGNAAQDNPASAWSASGPGTVTLLSDGVTADPKMSYLLNPAGFSTQTWQLSTTATKSQTVTLPFHYNGFHAFFQVTVFVQVFHTTGAGTSTTTLISQGPVDCCTPPSGGFNLSGSTTLNVAPGDVYGFRFGGSNFDSNNQLGGTFSVDLHPDNKDECKKGGWEQFGFRNQGQCVRFIETGKDSR